MGDTGYSSISIDGVASLLPARHSEKLQLTQASPAVQRWMNDLEGVKSCRAHADLMAFKTWTNEIDWNQSSLTRRIRSLMNPADLALSKIAYNMGSMDLWLRRAEEEKVCASLAESVDR